MTTSDVIQYLRDQSLSSLSPRQSLRHQITQVGISRLVCNENFFHRHGLSGAVISDLIALLLQSGLWCSRVTNNRHIVAENIRRLIDRHANEAYKVTIVVPGYSQ
jgi:hypothetical protein